MPLPSHTHYNNPNPNQPNPNSKAQPPPVSHLLATLRADEIAIINRKHSIRRFGAGWLRPPGVPKTLQGMDDERLEREEQEMAAQRDQMMEDAQAAAEEEEAAVAAAAAAAAGIPVGGRPVEETEGMNLDDEIPEAGGGWESSDDSDFGADHNRGNGIRGDGEEISIAVDADIGASFTGVEEEGEGDYAARGMLEGEGRDLDEEAGSYQHTDTDESDFEEGGSFVVGAGEGGILGRSVWGSQEVAVGYDGATSGARRSSRRSGGRASRGRESRG
ncbi:MAG: hypothetical protein Q9208_004018 [Pyrenodesmia sp. 3 TL-2023]